MRMYARNIVFDMTRVGSSYDAQGMHTPLEVFEWVVVFHCRECILVWSEPLVS